MGGGTLGAIGSHVIDSFRWMLGTEITGVSCMLSTHIAERPDKSSGTSKQVTSDDEAKLHFRFADSTLTKNTTGSAALSVVESGTYENRLEIYGTTGALMVGESGELFHSPAARAPGNRCRFIRIRWRRACDPRVGHAASLPSRVKSSKPCAKAARRWRARQRLRMVIKRNWYSTLRARRIRVLVGLVSRRWRDMGRGEEETRNTEKGGDTTRRHGGAESLSEIRL